MGRFLKFIVNNDKIKFIKTIKILQISLLLGQNGLLSL